MTPVERLQAAIDKIARLKVETTAGPWSYLDGPEYASIESETDAGVRPLALVGNRLEDAELIVTLHRTIDAQLAILRAALEARPTSESDWRYELALADAILGVQS